MVLVTERWPIELQFRRSTHAFTLTDIPLTLALVFATGTHAFFAVLAGLLVALLLRRMPPVKLAFNLAQYALVTAVLIIVVHLAASVDPGFGWITWGAVLAATQIGGVLTIVQILAAMVLTEGRVSRDQVRQMFGMDLVVTMTGTVDGARRRHPLDRAAGGDAAAADPDPDRLRRLPRVRPGARGPREGEVPLRGQPHPVRVARGRRRARGPARGSARGLPRRAGRGHPLRRRRRRAAAHRPRPGHRPRGDGARRRGGGHGAAHVRRGL